jgi:hypothetical protein
MRVVNSHSQAHNAPTATTMHESSFKHVSTSQLAPPADARNVTYRGAEKVVNIGNAMEVDSIYFESSTLAVEAVNIGRSIDPYLD